MSGAWDDLVAMYLRADQRLISTIELQHEETPPHRARDVETSIKLQYCRSALRVNDSLIIT